MKKTVSLQIREKGNSPSSEKAGQRRSTIGVAAVLFRFNLFNPKRKRLERTLSGFPCV